MVEPPSRRAPPGSVPPELEVLCLEALAREARERVGSAAEIGRRLQDFATGASRRRDSLELTSQAAERLAALERDGGSLPAEELYAAHEDAGQLLEHALQLWPDNARAAELNARNLARHLDEEIARGDLLWARLHLSRLARLPPAGVEPGGFAARLDAAVGARRRRRWQRVALAAAVGVLLVAAAALAWRGAAEARRKDLFARLNRLRTAETALAAELAHRGPR